MAPFVKANRLLRCRSGVSVLEFALVAPLVMLLIMGIVEFSLIMFVTSVMEGATTDTSRLGKTGYIEPGFTRQEEITNNIITRTGGILNPALITITTTIYPSFNSVNKPEPCYIAVCTSASPPGTYDDVNGNGQWDEDMGKAGLGNAGDVVVYTVTYPWPVMTPMIGAIIGYIFPITARSVVRNEPFSA